MEIVFGVIVLLASLFMVVTIMLQSSNVKGLGAVAGQMDSYFRRTRQRPSKRSWRWAPRLPLPFSWWLRLPCCWCNPQKQT